jgi:hypothetical protein
MTEREDDILLARMRVLEEEARARRYNQLAEFVPFSPQAEFIKLGATKTERAFIANNQGGKSHVGAIELAAHLTGRYPKSWEGKRFERPIRAWAAGVSALAVRDIQQKKLFGQPGTEPGSGRGVDDGGGFRCPRQRDEANAIIQSLDAERATARRRKRTVVSLDA